MFRTKLWGNPEELSNQETENQQYSVEKYLQNYKTNHILYEDENPGCAKLPFSAMCSDLPSLICLYSNRNYYIRTNSLQFYLKRVL